MQRQAHWSSSPDNLPSSKPLRETLPQRVSKMCDAEEWYLRLFSAHTHTLWCTPDCLRDMHACAQKFKKSVSQLFLHFDFIVYTPVGAPRCLLMSPGVPLGGSLMAAFQCSSLFFFFTNILSLCHRSRHFYHQNSRASEATSSGPSETVVCSSASVWVE